MSCRATAQLAPRSLFNGRDLAGWHADVPAADTNAQLRSPFIVRNGMLVSLGEPRGHLISDSSYRDYRLQIEYRFPATPGNAGVLVHASTPRALYAMFPRSIEVQMEHGNAGDFWCIVEDVKVPDMERRRGPPANWGITEGKARRIVNLTDGSEKPLGEWNSMVIEAVGRAIRVWLNGDLVNYGFDATADSGRIALQAEGAEVEFRLLSLTPFGALTSAPSAASPSVTPLIELRLVHDQPAAGRQRVEHEGQSLYLDAQPVITDADLRVVRPVVRDTNLFMQMEVTLEGAQRLYELTRVNIGNRLAVLVDSRVRNAPVIQSAVGGGTRLTGSVNLPAAEAERLATLIRARWPEPD